MIIKTRGFSANEGDPSVGNSGPDAIEQDLDNLYNNSKELEDIVNAMQEDIKNIVAGGTIPLDHSSSDVIYGLGSTTKHGHVKVINDLTKEEYADGEALSAYQGFNLNSEKAPNNHVSANNTYGLGTPTEYGHTKVINDLTKNAYANGEALSAYQGKVLDDKITALIPPNVIYYGGSIPNDPTGTRTLICTFDITKYSNLWVMGANMTTLSHLINTTKGWAIKERSGSQPQFVVFTLSTTPYRLTTSPGGSGYDQCAVEISIVGNIATLEAVVGNYNKGGQYLVYVY